MPVQIDVSSAAVERLRAYPPFAVLLEEGLIGTEALASAPLSEKLAGAWLFQGLDDEGRPFRDPEGSGTSVIVLTEREEWATPNRHNTASFPMLQMLVYTDCSRGIDGTSLTRDADRKVKHIVKTLNPCFHLVGNTEEDQAWPGLRVHSSVRSSRMTLREVPGTQGLTVRAEVTFELVTD